MQTTAGGDRADPEHDCDLARGEFLPAREAKELLILWTELGERSPDGVRLGGRRHGLERRRQLATEPFGQPLTPALGPLLVGQHAPRHAVAPQTRRVATRDVVEAPPGDEEGLGQYVGTILDVRRAPKCVGQHGPPVLGVQTFEASLRSPTTVCRLLPSCPHSPICPPRVPALLSAVWHPSAPPRLRRSGRGWISLGVVARIGIAVFDGAEELDFAGPWEVLAAWRDQHPEEADVVLVGETTEPVRCAKGMQVLPQATWEDVGALDVLVYPGGRGTRPQLGDERIRERLRGLNARGALLASVCTGSLVFADAGLLDGRRATTHWSAFEKLVELGTDVEADREARFVDTGDIITAAGVSAGIDMALHLVGRLSSADRAREVRRYIQYDPEPPY
jgi:putative intracellular protease/amidase